MGAAPTQVQVDVYAELGLLHDPRSPFFVARPGAHAVATDGHIANTDGQPVLIELRAGIANRTGNPAPIRVAPEKCRFYQG